MTDAPSWVYRFSDSLEMDDAQLSELLGGKGASLNRMTRAGFAVPPGFTVTTSACREYLEGGGNWPAKLWEQVCQQVHCLEAESGREFGKPPSPLLLAIRSGAAKSMPGMMSTILNCGLTRDQLTGADHDVLWDEFAVFLRAIMPAPNEKSSSHGHASARPRIDELLRQYESEHGEPFPDDPWQLLRMSVESVFQSCQLEKARVFRRRNAMKEDPITAVNIQVMCPTSFAGVLFSRDPLDSSRREMVVEVVPGIGDKLVGGHVQPRRFFVGREDNVVTAATRDSGDSTDDAPTLPSEALGRLAMDAKRLEQLFDATLDIEWGYHDQQFVFFQARPMQTDSSAERVAEVRRQEVECLRSLAKSTRKVWGRHNLSESLPSPTPLTWDIMRRFMSGSGGFGQLYRQMGYRPSKRVCRTGFLELIGGRIYADPDRMAELFSIGLPFRYDLDALADDPAVLEQAPTQFDAPQTDPAFLFKLPGVLWRIFQTVVRSHRSAASVAEEFDSRLLPSLTAYVQQQVSLDLSSLADRQLVRLFKRRCQKVMDEFAPRLLRPGLFGGMALASLRRQLTELLGKDDGENLARDLMGESDQLHDQRQARLLSEIARGEESLSAFLDEFGHRGPGEMDLACPRWREEHQHIRQLISWRGQQDPLNVGNELKADVGSASDDKLAQHLADCGAGSLLPRVQRVVRRAQILLPYRETGKHYWMLAYDSLRRVTQELASRWELDSSIYFLSLEEIENWAEGSHVAVSTIHDRQQNWRLMRQLWFPEVIDSARLDDLESGVPSENAAACLTGTTVSNGFAEGTVWLIGDNASLPPADFVLVSESFDVDIAIYLDRAKALVVNHGGMLSHAAILARQRGIPAIVCEGARQKLKTGDQVVVDGCSGKVTRRPS